MARVAIAASLPRILRGGLTPSIERIAYSSGRPKVTPIGNSAHAARDHAATTIPACGRCASAARSRFRDAWPRGRAAGLRVLPPAQPDRGTGRALVTAETSRARRTTGAEAGTLAGLLRSRSCRQTASRGTAVRAASARMDGPTTIARSCATPPRGRARVVLTSPRVQTPRPLPPRAPYGTLDAVKQRRDQHRPRDRRDAMVSGRSYDQITLGPCAVCWHEVKHAQPCTWDSPRRTWRHVRCPAPARWTTDIWATRGHH
jgi:hypothetical protein